MSFDCIRTALRQMLALLALIAFHVDLDGQELEKICLPGVVLIENPGGTGSGFFINKSGIVVTNSHVVGRWTPAYQKVRLRDGRTMRVLEIRSFEDEYGVDLAFVYCDAPSDIQVLPIAPSTPDPGTQIIAIGHPHRSEWIVSRGVISGSRDQILLQHDAAINPGNSGGPLIDQNGRVVGVVVSIDIDYRGRDLEGLNNAIRPEWLTWLLKKEGITYSVDRLIKSNASPVELAWADIQQAQVRVNEDRIVVDSLWESYRLKQRRLDSSEAASKGLLESGAMISAQIDGKKKELDQQRRMLEAEREELTRDISDWGQRKSSLQQEIFALQRQRDELSRQTHVSRIQGGVNASSGFLRFDSDDYGQNHIQYRGEVFLAARFGTNADHHGADLFGVAASIMGSFGIEGVSYTGTLMNDLTLFVEFAERVRLQGGIGINNGHPLFTHKNYVFGSFRWNWASDHYLSYGLYGSAIKDNGSDVVGWSAGLFVGLNVKFLRL